MQQLISEQDDKDGDSRAEAITTLLQGKNSSRRYRKIRGALDRLRGNGLTALEIPVKDSSGKIIDWKTITDKEQIHNTLLERNKIHLNQAVDTTPFGSGQ